MATTDPRIYTKEWRLQEMVITWVSFFFNLKNSWRVIPRSVWDWVGRPLWTGNYIGHLQRWSRWLPSRVLCLLLEALKACEWHPSKQETSRSPRKRLCKGSPNRRETVWFSGLYFSAKGTLRTNQLLQVQNHGPGKLMFCHSWNLCVFFTSCKYCP